MEAIQKRAPGCRDPGERRIVSIEAMKNSNSLLENLLAHDAWIRLLARQLVADEHAAEDLAHDAWVQALRTPPKPGSFRAWLGRVIRNLARKRHRSEVHRREREQVASRAESLPSAREILEQEATRLELAKVVCSLEEPYRSAILYRYFQNLPPREIAQRLEVSPAAVEGRLRRGLDQLRARLDREFGNRAHWSAALLPLLGVGPAGVAVGAGDATGSAAGSMANAAIGSTATGANTAAGSVAGSMASASTSLLTGALVMSTKIKIGIALLLAIGLAYTFWPRSENRKTEERTETEASQPAPTVTRKDETIAPAPVKEANVTTGTANQKPAALPAAVPPPAAGPTAAQVTGTVTTETGQPIPEAKIQIDIWNNSDTLARSRLPEPRTTKTDASGRFAFPGLHPELRLQLMVDAKGYSRERRNLRVGGSHLDIVLAVAGSIAGRVVDRAGRQPVENAVVSALPVYAGGGYAWGGKTDLNGRYRIHGLRPGTWSLCVYSPRHPPETRHRIHVVVERDRETTADLLVEQGVTLRGQVVDAEGRAVAGARVKARMGNHEPAVTDPNGRFSLPGLPEEVSVHLDADGKTPVDSGIRFTPDEQRSGLAMRTYCLKDVARIRGRVLGPDRAPLEGAEVKIWQSGLVNTRRWTTDADGRFEAVIERPEKPRSLIVNKDGLARAVFQPEPLAPGEVRDGVVVQLTRGAEIRGKVVSADGVPVAGHRVWLKPWPAPFRVTGWVVKDVTTKEDGSFAFTSLPAGAYQVSANGRDLPDRGYRTRGRRGEIRVADGAVVSDIVLTPTRRIPLRGRVADDRDRPVPGVKISAFSGSVRTQSNADGRFVLEDMLESCETGIRASKDGYRLQWSPLTSSLLVTPNTPELVLRMTKSPPGIRGRVLRADTREPVTQFWIRVHTALERKDPTGDAVRFRATTTRYTYQSADGWFLVSRMFQGGLFAVEAGTDQGLVTAEPVRVQVDADAPPPVVELFLQPAGSVRGRVVSPDHEPVERARVEARSSLDGRALGTGRAYTDHEGRFQILTVPPGSAEIRARHQDWVENKETVQVTAGGPAEVEVRLGGTSATLHVQVRGLNDQPIAGAWVRLYTPGGEEVGLNVRYMDSLKARSRENPRLTFDALRDAAFRTDNQGRVQRRYLPPGNYRVKVKADGFRPEERNVSVQINARNTLEVTLAAGR